MEAYLWSALISSKRFEPNFQHSYRGRLGELILNITIKLKKIITNNLVVKNN